MRAGLTAALVTALVLGALAAFLAWQGGKPPPLPVGPTPPSRSPDRVAVEPAPTPVVADLPSPRTRSQQSATDPHDRESAALSTVDDSTGGVGSSPGESTTARSGQLTERRTIVGHPASPRSSRRGAQSEASSRSPGTTRHVARESAAPGGAGTIVGHAGADAEAAADSRPHATDAEPADSAGRARGGAPAPASFDRADESQAEQPAAPQVWMRVSSGTVAVGERVPVVIEIASDSEVGHTPFHVTFDPHVLEFDYGEEGSFLRSDGNQTAFFAATSSHGGSVVVGLSRLGRVPGVSGSGDLCILNFNAIGPGNAALGFSRAKVRDASNQIIPSIFQPAFVVVH